MKFSLKNSLFAIYLANLNKHGNFSRISNFKNSSNEMCSWKLIYAKNMENNVKKY